MISLHYTSHTKAYNTIYTACNIVEAIYSFTVLDHGLYRPDNVVYAGNESSFTYQYFCSRGCPPSFAV